VQAALALLPVQYAPPGPDGAAGGLAMSRNLAALSKPEARWNRMPGNSQGTTILYPCIFHSSWTTAGSWPHLRAQVSGQAGTARLCKTFFGFCVPLGLVLAPQR